MKKIVVAGILTAGAIIILFWFFKPEQSYQPIIEEPHPEVDSLFNVMNRALRTRKYDQGAHLAQQALALSRKDRYRYGEVNALIALGYVLSHKAKYDSSNILFKKARDLVKKYRLDPALRHRAGTYMAENFQFIGEIDRAQAYLNEALAYFIKTDDTLRICASYNSLGLLYQSQGMYDRTEKVYQKGLEIARTIPGDRYYERSFTGNLGILYAILGKLDTATPLIETSLRMGREMNDPVAQGIDLRYLGSIQFVRGNFREALTHYLEDARLMADAGENHGLIRAYRNVAKVYDALNDFENAELYYRKAVEVVDTKLGGKYKQFPQAYLRYATHKMRRGDHEEAEKLLEKAIEGYSSLSMPNELAACYLVQAELEFNRGKFNRSLEGVRKVFKLLQKIEAGDIDLAEAHFWFGRVYHALAYKDSALVHYKKAVELSSETMDSDIAWQVHHNLSRFYAQCGDWQAAAKHARQAMTAIERLRQFTISPELGSRFLANKVEVYQNYFDILFENYQRRRTAALLDSLYIISEKTRSRALFDDLRLGEQNIFFQLKESAKLQDIEEQIVSLNLLIRKAKMQPGEKRQPKFIESLSGQVESLQREYALKITEFAASKPELSALLGVDSQTSIADLQEALKPGTALLAYYCSVQDVYAFVIDAADATLINLKPAPSDLWERVWRLRKPFQDFKEGRIDFLRLTFDAKLSHELFQQLVAPLSEFLENTSRLIIVPAGALTYLPFEMLVTGKKSGVRNNRVFSEYGQFEYLIEKFAISYLPAGAMLPLLKKKEIPQTEKTLLAFGNPIRDQSKKLPLLPPTVTAPGMRNLSFTPLPAASLEIQGIANLFDPREVVALSGAEAAESDYKQEAGRFRFIHFATHGYIDEQNPNFSALLLNPGHKNEDGLLYAYEIYAHPLSAELVSLSACETALGQFRESEGLISFVQPFFAAGSQSVMASLWSVAESTSPLMVSFYKSLRAATPKAEALRQAKLAFMRGSSQMNQQSYSRIHPFLWAPFVLYGIE